MNNTEKHIEILELFTTKDIPHVSQPFTQDGFLCATNGWAIVSFPEKLIPSHSYKPASRLKTARNVLKPKKPVDKTLTFPVADLIIDDEQVLKSILPKEVRCKKCDGTRIHKCNCGFCQFNEECEECEGEGVMLTTSKRTVSFLGTPFTYSVLLPLIRVAELLDLKEFSVIQKAGSLGRRPLILNVNEYEFALMSLRNAGENPVTLPSKK